MKEHIDAEAGMHWFSGSCAPGGNTYVTCETFSVGIFEWVPKKSGKGLKKSAVKLRVSGLVSNPQPVFEKAVEICKSLDAGTYTGPKRVLVS